MATIAEALSIAFRHQQAGQYAEAERIYDLVLRTDPNQPDAWHLLGVLAHWQGQVEVAAGRLARAVEADAGRVDFHTHRAIALTDLRRPAEAAACWRLALALAPANAEAWQRLSERLVETGVLAPAARAAARAAMLDPSRATALETVGALLTRSGQAATAAALYARAVAAAPGAMGLWARLGDALRTDGRHAAAAAAYRAAVAADPGAATNHANLALCRYWTGDLAASVASCRRALAVQPDTLSVHNNLGTALAGLRRTAEAERAYRIMLALAPTAVDGWTNLGSVIQGAARNAEALACHDRALALAPRFGAALMNRGSVLSALGRFDEAVATFLELADVEPGNAEALVQAGANLQNQGKVGQALAAFGRAKAIDPLNRSLHNAIGNAYLALGRLTEAEASFRRALVIDPAHGEAHNNLGAVHRNQGRQDAAVVQFRHSVATMPHDVRIHSNLLLTLCYQAGVDEAALLAEHVEWSRRHAEPLARAIRPFANPRDPGRRLRIGYVSPDLRAHAAAYFLEPMFEEHDHDRFEIVAYAEVARPDGMTDRLRALCDRWRFTVGLSDEAVARQIRDDGIDILVDLAGHTGNNRMLTFARRPAPVQVTYLGYATTTGLSVMDYLLTERWTVPEGPAEQFYTETIWRLPEVLRCYRAPPQCPPVGPLPSAARGGRIVFGSFNAFVKVTAPVLGLWGRLLAEVPDSTLLIVTDSPADRVARLFAPHGVDPGRLRVVGRQGIEGFLALHNEVDIALDPFPHTGATTTLHSLWMGVPVVSLAGRRSSERGGIGIMGPLGLQDLVADTPDDYVAIARRLASDSPALARLRADLRPRMAASTFLDAARFTRQMEDAYREMWRRWCAGP